MNIHKTIRTIFTTNPNMTQEYAMQLLQIKHIERVAGLNLKSSTI